MSSSTLLSPDAAAVVSLTGAAPAEAASVVSHTLLKTPELRVISFRFAAGQELTTHTNRRRVLVQVIEGAGEFFFNGTWQTLAAGALLHLPPNHPHAVRATEPFAMLLTLGAEPAGPSFQP